MVCPGGVRGLELGQVLRQALYRLRHGSLMFAVLSVAQDASNTAIRRMRRTYFFLSATSGFLPTRAFAPSNSTFMSAAG